MSKGKIFLYFCVSFVGGIFIRSFLFVPGEILVWIIILGTICALPIWRNKRFVIFGFCILFVALGMYRYQQKAEGSSEIARYNDQGEVVLEGIISRDPDVRSNIIRFTVEPEIITVGGTSQRVNGNFSVSAKRYPEYQYGDEIKVRGEPETPKNFSEFDYRAYLAKEGIYSTISFPEITMIGHDQGNTLLSTIFNIKHSLRDSIARNLASPESEILSGILLGDQRQVSDGLLEKFNITGTRHIMAISGMNITIISEFVLALLIAIGFWRAHAFFLSIIFITLFIFMVGAPASAVRAGVMAGVLLFAQNLGRPKNEGRAVLYAAFVMMFVNPFLLQFDAGFQLSFLAIMGIIYLSRYLNEKLAFLPKAFAIREVSAMTIAAQVATLPVLIVTFGRISLVSLPANILIVPFLPFVMAGGFGAALAGSLSDSMGRILFFPLWLILRYILLVIEVFAKSPLASFNSLYIHWLWIFPYYLLLFLFWRKYIHKKSITGSLATSGS